MSYYDLNETSATIKQPAGLKVKLRQHQLTSIAAMRELETQSSIIINKPTVGSGLYQTIRGRISSIEEFTESTYIIETNTAILADKVGSGKTYMIIGLILSKRVPVSHDRFVLGTDHYSIKMINMRESVGANLIVVPHNLANQWADFISKSNLKHLTLNTIADFDVFFDKDYVDRQTFPIDGVLTKHNRVRRTKANTTAIDKAIGKSKKKNAGSKTQVPNAMPVYERKRLNIKKMNKILEEYSVILLNVNRYKFFKEIFRSVRWARVIIDEMDSAGIPTTFDEYGNFNWFLTATPTAIFNKSCGRYVRKIFGYNSSLLKYFTVKNKDEYVDQSIILPKPHVYMINTLMQKVVSAIKDLIPADVLQLINAGNMKEAVAKLNCDIDTEENIVAVLTDKIKVELHNLKTESAYVKSLIPIDEARVKRIKTDIGRCNTRLETITERIGSIKNESCFICTEPFESPTILDCCKSVFCLKCLLQALKLSNNKCPFCRCQLKSNKEYHVISSASKKKTEIVENKSSTAKKFTDMDKADVLEEILLYISKNVDNPKILIFSDYSQTFDKIIKNIAKAKLKYSMISGTPAHMANVLETFETGDLNILMLDSKHYGSGLNLQTANYLILYHRMSAELETQVIGRAHRFGRKIPLKIIYLINQSENSTSKLSKNPFKPKAVDELHLITDPATDIKADDSDSSSTETIKPIKKGKKTVTKKANIKDMKFDNTSESDTYSDTTTSSSDSDSDSVDKFDTESTTDSSSDSTSSEEIIPKKKIKSATKAAKK